MIFKSRINRNGFIKAAVLGLALITTAPAFSNVTRVSEFVDVDPNVWAYKALKELVEKYDVLEGFPNKTFRGDKPATRYEMAQALYEVIKVMDVGKVDGADIETVGKLKSYFERELSQIRNKVASLEGRVSALEEGGVKSAGSDWTDRIKVSGDLTNSLRSDWILHNGRTDAANWGTRARLGVDAVLIGDDPNSGVLGEGIAHIRMNGGNGGSGTFAYPTTGNNLDDIFIDGSNAMATNNNSLFASRAQDSRMNVYLDQAYYTQVFKFSKADPCTNEVKGYPNFFATVDLGQQDLWNTFHKSLVREDSLDGFINTRIIHGDVGGSDAVSEALHLGLTWLGKDSQGTDTCGNPEVDSCGKPMPGFFQALSVDYAFNTFKSAGDPYGITAALGIPGALPFTSATTSRTFDNQSHSLATTLLYDLPSEWINTGMLQFGGNLSHMDYNNAAFLAASVSTGAATFTRDEWSTSLWTKWEQFFGRNRTLGMFGQYSWNRGTTGYNLVGAATHSFQIGALLNTTFMPDTWNFNKDQLGLAYSFSSAHRNGIPSHLLPTSITPTGLPTALAYTNAGSRAEHIIEAYYRKYITENISITPDLMLQFTPNGNSTTAVSGSIRSTFKLPNWNDGGAFDQFGYRDWSQRIAKYKAAHSGSSSEE